MFNIFGKRKYKAWFFIKEANSYEFKKKKRFIPNSTKPLIKYKGKKYDVDIDNPTFRKGLYSHYCFEFNGKQILTTLKDSSDTTIKELLYMDEAIKQSFSALDKKKLDINWIHLVFAIGFGLLLGWILGGFFPLS